MTTAGTPWIESTKKLLRKKTFFGMLAVVTLAIIYFYYQSAKANNTTATYTLSPVSKGTIVVSVSGTGQVAVTHQVDIKPKVSGQITKVNIEEGQSIKTGTIIAHIDPKDAQKAVRNASISLENAKLSLQKIKQPTDSYTVSQAKSDVEQAKNDLQKLQNPPTAYDLMTAQDAVTQAERDLESAKNNLAKVTFDNEQTLEKAYDEGYSAVSNAYLDMPTLVKDAYSVQWNETDTIDKNHVNSYKKIIGEDSIFLKNLKADYDAASKLFNDNFNFFQKVARSSDLSTQYQLLDKTLTTAKAVSQSLESSRNVLDAVTNYFDYKSYFIASTVDALKPVIQADITTINKIITALQDAKSTIDTANQNSPFDLSTAKAAVSAAEEKLKEKQAALEKLKAGATAEDIATAKAKIQQKQTALDKLLAGANPLDIKAQELTVKDRENALLDAQQTLSDYTVTAPFDGIIAKVSVSKGDTVSSGTALVTAITKQLLAQISLNEVDVAKIKIGQKATLKFDAIDNLEITGEVVGIDTLGTTTQGVVSYNIKIAFDTQDERIKPGMSVSAAIITDVKQDVLEIPNSAIKSQGNSSYVETLKSAGPTGTDSSNAITTLETPVQIPVEIGIANDSMTEITNGLDEGDQIITKTTTANKTSSAGQPTGLGGIRIPGLGSGGSTNTRVNTGGRGG